MDKIPSKGSKSRRKGHGYERFTVNFFKKLGFDRALTTRNASRLMDNAKIDIYGVPFNIQCKAVEDRIDYQKLTDEITVKIKELCPDRSNFPIIIFHKRKKKTTVTMTLEEFEKLIAQSYGKTI